MLCFEYIHKRNRQRRQPLALSITQQLLRCLMGQSTLLLHGEMVNTPASGWKAKNTILRQRSRQHFQRWTWATREFQAAWPPVGGSPSTRCARRRCDRLHHTLQGGVEAQALHAGLAALTQANLFSKVVTWMKASQHLAIKPFTGLSRHFADAYR